LGVVLEEQHNENDTVETVEDVKIVYEKQLSFYVESAILDYRKDFFGREGFFIDTGSNC
jgi:Fe-S cluster assembly iron-binding protein IscA